MLTRLGVARGPLDRRRPRRALADHRRDHRRGPRRRAAPRPPRPIEAAHAAFLAWRKVPAPRRGELVRLLGEELRAAKADLGRLVTLEAGKIVSEGLGEVQEMIDICDYAVGLSRQLFGLTIATERPEHRMMETWHPLGVVGVISRLQLPGRGLVVERRAGAGLRRRGGLEAVGEDPADRAGRPGAVRARRGAVRRRAGGPLQRARSAAARSARRWSTIRTVAAGLGHRLDRHGPRRRRRGWPPASPARCWSSAATTPPSSRPPPTWT